MQPPTDTDTIHHRRPSKSCRMTRSIKPSSAALLRHTATEACKLSVFERSDLALCQRPAVLGGLTPQLRGGEKKLSQNRTNAKRVAHKVSPLLGSAAPNYALSQQLCGSLGLSVRKWKTAPKQTKHRTVGFLCVPRRVLAPFSASCLQFAGPRARHRLNYTARNNTLWRADVERLRKSVSPG